MEKKHTPTTFHEWVKQTFAWVDNDVKRYMQRSWAASTKAANKRNKQETKRLQAENEKIKMILDEIQAELFIQIEDGDPIDGFKYREKIKPFLNQSV